ncbi:MAG: S9 family peptidase [Thermoanaerobaculia bacterium]|nr:S9 family peptidase [Thermoanaerobaculia bacterium]
MHRLLFALIFLPMLALAPSETFAAEEETDTLTVADYLEFERVADPRISPDGTQIVYTRRWVDAQTDRWASALWIMDADGSRHRFLIDGSNARWSPSGDRILFLGEDSHEKPQIFVRWMDAEGAVSQVTRVDVTPSSPVWSPDGSEIAFVAIVPAEDEWTIEMPKAPEGAEWTEAPRILDRLHYRQDRVGFTDPGFSHLFVVPASSGTARQLTEGEWNVGAQFDGLHFGATLSWMPDGKTLVFDGLKEEDVDAAYQRADIFALDVESAELRQLTSEPGYWTSPVVAPDGTSVAYLGYPSSEVTYEMPRLHVMGSDGSEPRLVSDTFDRPPGQLIWGADGQSVYFSAQDEGYVHVFQVGLGGEVRAVTTGPEALQLVSVGSKGQVGAGVVSSFHEPGDVVTIGLDDGETRRLTAVNDDLLAGKMLGEQEELWFEAPDGNRAHGWIVKPPDFDPEKDYPLLMEIHGGPFAMYVGRFDFRYQVYAAHGFVVLYTNPRGSTGYGESFSQAIDHAYPSVDYSDLMAGVDAVVTRGFIDEKRMYVGGCSGGGVLSSWVIGHTKRFAAAAVRCPVVNWLSMAGTTDIPNFTHSFFRKPFWEDPSDWLHHSSLMYVGDVSTPTAVMTGEQDLRTPMAQSEEYYAALKMRGVPSKLLRFAGEYHGTGSKPSNYMRTMLYMMSWYNRFTLDGEVEEEQ